MRRRWSTDPPWDDPDDWRHFDRAGDGAAVPQPSPPRGVPLPQCGWCGNDPDNCGCAADERLERWG